ncbi:phospholipase D delta-like [Senna tora]|uniref:phospholipase D n=1 Tax=Senna tora TaxID=362788 RepID=A0A835CJW2_9FABA|nr:phospholipase D delta-like [Senna tora]
MDNQAESSHNKSSKGGDLIFLHGDLDLRIVEAKSLPNLDLSSEASHSKLRKPFVDEHFVVPVAHPVQKIVFLVKDDDVLGAELIGVVEISVHKVLSGNIINDWFPVIGQYGSCLKPYPELHISVQFTPVQDKIQHHTGVPNTYFPLRRGGNVTLYQDAHVPDASLPEIPLEGGKVFQQGKCWEDICHAILEAHHLIYVIGWSVYHRVRLVREPTKPLPAGGELSLGELLKYKSQEGVRVVMLLWDDKTSHDTFFLKTEGVMQTHDEETKKFFKHSTVHCVLSPRYASNKLSVFKQQVVGTLFTHHQKCVILDTQGSGNNRKITAFIGGLDLCDGRYDTPQHRLFDNLDTVFKDDFHNPTLPSHCTSDQDNHGMTYTVKRDRISWILTPTTSVDGDKIVHVIEESDPETWNVQVFRSIDSGSVKGFPKDVKEAKDQNLLCGKNLKVDKSIHAAYVHAIRSAQRFIYIENQYFLGSSYHWPHISCSYPNVARGRSNECCCARNLVLAGTDNVYDVQDYCRRPSKAGLSERYHPQDYLNFYCLGKREHEISQSPSVSSQSAEHRALVYGYRMSLWAEHLGSLEETLEEPQSLPCMRYVNNIARHNWGAYVSEETRAMWGHLMQYPVHVSAEGRVSSLPDFESFPDVGVHLTTWVRPERDGASLKRRDSSVNNREDDLLIVTTVRELENEVGRSCSTCPSKGKVVFSIVNTPAYSGMAALPYFDEIDPSTVESFSYSVLFLVYFDFVLRASFMPRMERHALCYFHLALAFHLDHAASLPYFLEKTTFKGRVFMTYATKAIYKLLLSDYVKVSKVSVEDMLFDEQDINRSMDKIEVIDFHQTVEVNGIRFWCYTAGHVLGAAMFMVDIAGVRLLYTGDYSREEDRHLRAAETPQFSPDVCIIESTYGVQHHQPRHTREKRFTDVIHSTVSQGGRVLIPAFALGRAQELLLILDEFGQIILNSRIYPSIMLLHLQKNV